MTVAVVARRVNGVWTTYDSGDGGGGGGQQEYGGAGDAIVQPQARSTGACQHIEQWRSGSNGTDRRISCKASGCNKILLMLHKDCNKELLQSTMQSVIDTGDDGEHGFEVVEIATSAPTHAAYTI
jgi:hypothetical protein